jgi:integrase/recombinase XerD
MERQVRDFLTSLESQSAYSPSTRLAYDNDLRCFIEYLEKTLQRPPRLDDFNPRQIADFLQNERRAGRRPSTLLRRRASLRRFATFLRQRDPDWADTFDPSAYLIDEAITGAAPLGQPHYLTEAQIQSLWAVLESSRSPRARRDQAILSLLLESGLAVGTLIALNVADLDLEAERLRVNFDYARVVWLPLGKAVKPMQRYIKEGRPELEHHREEPALFISQTGARMSRQGVWQVLRQWGGRAKLPVTLSPRLVRHTAAFSLARSGHSVAEIQALLGHSNPLSTQALLRRLSASSPNREHKIDS